MPARNEAERIAPVIRAVRECVPFASVLVIDDDSSDSTPEVARDAGALVARLPFHLGYGGALQTGYRFAVAKGFDFVVQMDSDGQHRPTDLPKLLDLVLRDECDLAIGSRFVVDANGPSSGQPYEMGMLRSIGRRTLCFFARVGGLRVTDPTSGLQAMNARTLTLFASNLYPVDYPDVDVLLLAHRKGIRILEEAVDMRPSPRPSLLHSGWMPLYYAYRMLLSLWALSAVPRNRSDDPAPSDSTRSKIGRSSRPGGSQR
jgi:hypothetical protein